MPSDPDLPPGYDPELSEIFALAEDLADAVSRIDPNWCALAKLARDLTARLEVRCRSQTAGA